MTLSAACVIVRASVRWTVIDGVIDGGRIVANHLDQQAQLG